MKLYYSPGACSLSPHIVSREAGIAVDLKKVNLKEKVIDGGGDYRQVNAKGYVPALELDNGQRLRGPAIVQYLPTEAESGLAPSSVRALPGQEWLNY
jgi:glutathione S-transferase